MSCLQWGERLGGLNVDDDYPVSAPHTSPLRFSPRSPQLLLPLSQTGGGASVVPIALQGGRSPKPKGDPTSSVADEVCHAHGNVRLLAFLWLVTSKNFRGAWLRVPSPPRDCIKAYPLTWLGLPSNNPPMREYAYSQLPRGWQSVRPGMFWPNNHHPIPAYRGNRVPELHLYHQSGCTL